MNKVFLSLLLQVKSQSTGIVARAKTALKADPSTVSTGSITGSTGLKKDKKSSVQALEAAEDKARKSSAKTSVVARANTVQSTSKAAVGKKVSEGKKTSVVAEEEEEEVLGVPAVDELDVTEPPVAGKTVESSLSVDDNSNNRAAARRSGPPATTTTATTAAKPAPATSGSSLVAARKKQLHEQQAKSSPINTVLNRDKKVSTKTLDASQKLNKKPSLSTSLSDRVVKLSTEKLDTEKRVPLKLSDSLARGKKPSVPATTVERQFVKASTEKLDTVPKKFPVKVNDLPQKPKSPQVAIVDEKVSTPAAEKVDNKPEVRKSSQEEAVVLTKSGTVAKSHKAVTKKTSSINVVLASQQHQAFRKSSKEQQQQQQQPSIAEESQDVAVAVNKKLLNAVLDDQTGSADNLSTRVNLSSSSSLTSDQVINIKICLHGFHQHLTSSFFLTKV